MAIRILIVDDYSVVRQGLRMFLSVDSELEVVGEATNGLEGLELARDLHPDVILMDLVMPTMDGLSAMIAIRQELPDTEVLALTSVLQDDLILGAIRAGAIGYLLKDTDGNELRRAIKAAAAGQVQLSSQVAARLLQENWVLSSHEPLTARESEVLILLGRGRSNREMAAELGISERTVKYHIGNIFSKLGVVSRTQAAVHAIRLGLVPPVDWSGANR